MAVAKLEPAPTPWIIDAVDEYTVEDGCSLEWFLDNAKKKVAESVEVRIGAIHVPDNFMESIFETRTVIGKPAEVEDK